MKTITKRVGTAALVLAFGASLGWNPSTTGAAVEPPPVGGIITTAGDEADWLEALVEEEQLAQFQELARSAGALGFYRDPGDQSLVVVIPRDLRSTFDLAKLGSPPVSIKTKYSEVDGDAVALAKERLRKVVTNPVLAKESLAFFFNASLQKITVNTTIGSVELSEVLGDSWPLIDYRYGGVEFIVARGDDASPFSGGSSINLSNGDICTSGFTMVNGGARALVIPAHCGDPNNTVRTPTGTDMGKIGTDRHCGATPLGDNSDFQFVRNKAYTNTIWVGGGIRARVTDYGTPAVGASYRFSGRVSGETPQNQVVSETDGSLWITPADGFCGNYWWLLHLIVFHSDATCDGQPGDSGAPFYFKYNGPPPTVLMRGMVVARDRNSGPNCYAMKLSRMTNLSGYQILTTP